MEIINTISLGCNRRLKINFGGGELSSDAGCLLRREFISKLGFDELILPYGQMIHMYTFIVTNMDSCLQKLIKCYCKRGTMENFIKESKNGFSALYWVA